MPKKFSWLSKCGCSCPLHIAVRVSACKAALAVAIFFFFLPLIAFAETSVSGVRLVEQDKTAKTIKVEFDLTNASGDNWVWVFMKYSRAPGDFREWNHLILKGSGDSKGSPAATTILHTSDKRGVFIEGSGTNIQIVWNYGGTGGNEEPDNEVIDPDLLVKVFAIDMIEVPTGNFYIGDAYDNDPDSYCSNTSSIYAATNSFYQCTGTAVPYEITVASSTVIELTNDPVSEHDKLALYGDSWDMGIGDSINYFSTTGYNAFFFMEHELSQGQYRDFLNTLPRVNSEDAPVQENRIAGLAEEQYVMTTTASIYHRNSIRAEADIPDSPEPVTFGCDATSGGGMDQANDGEWVAMNYMSWMDLCAYADWAALRPMSEFEYEKACRGDDSPITGEYAWRSTDIDQAELGILSGRNTVNELINPAATSTSAAVYGGDSSLLILRSGAIYEGASGASVEGKYGGYDLSGNVSEMVVTVSSAAGRSFQGTHGDGVLGTTGFATNSDWPGFKDDQVKGSAGTGQRGGDWAQNSPELQTSNRTYANHSSYSGERSHNTGGRLARTKPT